MKPFGGVEAPHGEGQPRVVLQGRVPIAKEVAVAFRKRVEERGEGEMCNPFARAPFLPSMQMESGLLDIPVVRPLVVESRGFTEPPPCAAAALTPLTELVNAVAVAFFKVQSGSPQTEAVRFFLKASVLSGTEVRLAVQAHHLEVEVVPPNGAMETLLAAHQAQLAERLNARLAFVSVTVRICQRKEGVRPQRRSP